MVTHPVRHVAAAMPRAAALFAGGVSMIGDGGHQSGIRKRRIQGRAEITFAGVRGDEIVDRRFHGGPDRALNWFPQEHYATLREQFHLPDEPLEAGGFGENISSLGLTDDSACIGDVYAVGGAVLQISQPRSPCWKLSARFGIDRFSVAVQAQRRTGWYLRVLQEGMVAEGDDIYLVRRDGHACAIAAFWDIVLAEQPDIERLAELARIDALALDWRRKLAMRVDWLRDKRRG
jgi:MOSC domain-containing protein YiiM